MRNLMNIHTHILLTHFCETKIILCSLLDLNMLSITLHEMKWGMLRRSRCVLIFL